MFKILQNKTNIITSPHGDKIKIKIYGKNNKIFIDPQNKEFKGRITVYGNNNNIIINKGRKIALNIYIGLDEERTCNNTNIFIDTDFYCGNGTIEIGEDGYSLNIGKDCLFADDVEILGCDNHSIIDGCGTRVNKAKKLTIGNHVWCAKHVKLLKNVQIPNGCIIALGSVVASKFDKENIIIAGNPAKIIKDNIKWIDMYPNNYDKVKV